MSYPLIKYFLAVTLFLLIPLSVFGYEAYGFSLNGNPKDGWVLTMPEGQIYYLDWINNRLRTAGIDGTCYFYDGEKIEQCTLQEYSVFLQ